MAIGPCPRCANRASLYRCDHCGDVRCDSATSTRGKEGCAVRGQAAHPNFTCLVCKKGKYKSL